MPAGAGHGCRRSGPAVPFNHRPSHFIDRRASRQWIVCKALFEASDVLLRRRPSTEARVKRQHPGCKLNTSHPDVLWDTKTATHSIVGEQFIDRGQENDVAFGELTCKTRFYTSLGGLAVEADRSISAIARADIAGRESNEKLQFVFNCSRSLPLVNTYRPTSYSQGDD
jgi:hypothetical protein